MSLRYEQRRPETTPLYRLIATHLETFLAEARAAHERGVPRYVERELRAYLACGVHAHGFLRARCSGCRKELLVAFSCKLRGVCPSCNARRMCSTAAHLTDQVFPEVPISQWVLSVPFELRLLLARNAAALSAVGRIFVREIWRWQREQFWASLMRPRNAEAPRPRNIRGGAVCFPQRFGGSLDLNVHFHVAVPDGVFSREPAGAQGVAFHQLRYCARPPLSLERLSVLADGRVAYRIKNPRGPQTHRVMSPTQFLARLCALIPTPALPARALSRRFRPAFVLATPCRRPRTRELALLAKRARSKLAVKRVGKRPRFEQRRTLGGADVGRKWWTCCSR